MLFESTAFFLDSIKLTSQFSNQVTSNLCVKRLVKRSVNVLLKHRTALPFLIVSIVFKPRKNFYRDRSILSVFEDWKKRRFMLKIVYNMYNLFAQSFTKDRIFLGFEHVYLRRYVLRVHWNTEVRDIKKRGRGEKWDIANGMSRIAMVAKSDWTN